MESINQTAYALLPISLIGSILNWSIFYAVHKLQSFNHSFGYLSANQAIADAMHSTTFQLYFCPMVLLDSAEMKEWSHHCGFILLLCYELSVMIHLAISLNRFTAVWAPYEYQTIFSNKHTKIMIAAIWIFTGTVAFLFYEKSCHFYYEEKIHFLTFTSSKFCGYIGWYGDFLKNASIVAVVVSIDMLTVFKVRKMSKKVVANISDQSQHRMSCREMRFLKQTVTQGSVFMLELLTYFFVPQYFENKWVVFFATSFAWVAVHAVDGSIKSISLYSCKIPFEGKDPNVIGYLCAVDRCIHDFFQETEYDRFELMWRKLPDSLNWCATNAQMSVTKFTSKKEVMMFKVKNMMEKKNMEIGERCTAVVISFDNDDSLRDLDLEKILKTCTVHDVEFSSARIQGLANVLKSFNSAVIDLLIVGPSKASSYLLFQQFLGDYYDYLPTLCQINFAHSLPRAREENGFLESMQRLRSEKKFLLMGASKDRTDMHLNLFFGNMDKKYCRERYFRYLSYF